MFIVQLSDNVDGEKSATNSKLEVYFVADLSTFDCRQCVRALTTSLMYPFAVKFWF